MLHFVFHYKEDISVLDGEIHTRRRDGILFAVLKSNHYRYLNNPTYYV